MLRLAAAAGRDVGYGLLRAAAALPEGDVHVSLRRAVEHGVLVADQATGRYRFRHALLAEAVYSTLLPGEREATHARLGEELARAEPPAPAGELARHWAAAGRAGPALVASIAAAREAEAVFGLAEALAHLERALALWPTVPGAAALAGLDLAELASWAAEQAVPTGAAPRAVELGRRAVALVGDRDRVRSALLHARLGRYLLYDSRRDAGLAAFERAVELLPPDPPSPERAQVLAALGSVLMLTWRHDESRTFASRRSRSPVRSAHARPRSGRWARWESTSRTSATATTGSRRSGRRCEWREETRAPEDLDRAYIWLTDVADDAGTAP